jgi:crossover junction endodeoxyribonuclease RuvC
MEQYYIGIDLSLTGTGVIILDKDCKVKEQNLIITKSSQLIEERIIHIYCMIETMVLNHPQCKIYIEGLSFGSSGASMLELAGLHYYIRTCLKSIHKSFEIIPPTTLKKFVTGKGNSKKEQMLLQVYKKWNMEFDNNNICDAFCLAKYCYENNKEK